MGDTNVPLLGALAVAHLGQPMTGAEPCAGYGGENGGGGWVTLLLRGKGSMLPNLVDAVFTELDKRVALRERATG